MASVMKSLIARALSWTLAGCQVLAVGLVLSWALAACETLTTPTESSRASTIAVLAEVCSTYDSALNVLIGLESSLSDAEVAKVSQLNEVVAEICAPGVPPPADAVQAISMINAKTNELLLMSALEGA